MKHYFKNPRQITRQQFTDLRDWLRELGDLSGIVHDLNSDEIISGNQRMEVFNLADAEIQIVETLPAPDEQGTVARGFVVWENKKYTYRAVRWTPKQCEKANIVANKAGGSFDFDTLANQFELDDLLEWGFSDKELQLITPEDKSAEDVVLDQAVQLEPAREYIVVMCDTPEEFDDLRRLLDLHAVRRGGYHAGSVFDDVGTQRVIHASDLIGRLDHADRDPL